MHILKILLISNTEWLSQCYLHWMLCYRTGKVCIQQLSILSLAYFICFFPLVDITWGITIIIGFTKYLTIVCSASKVKKWEKKKIFIFIYNSIVTYCTGSFMDHLFILNHSEEGVWRVFLCALILTLDEIAEELLGTLQYHGQLL